MPSPIFAMAKTDYDFQLTRSQIIEGALGICGALAPGETASGNDMAKGILLLNSIVKSWEAKRIFLWQEYTDSFSTSNGTSSYSSDPADESMLYLDRIQIRENSTDVDLEVLGFEIFQEITRKAKTGKPTTAAVNYLATPVIHLWPVPDATYTIIYNAVRKLKDFESASGMGDFSERWGEALTFALAYRWSFDFGLPTSERRDLKKQAEQEFQEAASSDREREDLTVSVGAFD